MLYYRVLKYIGAYTAAMGGVDMIVFTGGIGENDPHIREMVGSHLEYIGLNFDPAANKGVWGKDVILSKPGSRVFMSTVTTNEELVIAQDTMNILISK
jgi:acetate kinase